MKHDVNICENISVPRSMKARVTRGDALGKTSLGLNQMRRVGVPGKSAFEVSVHQSETLVFTKKTSDGKVTCQTSRIWGPKCQPHQPQTSPDPQPERRMAVE